MKKRIEKVHTGADGPISQVDNRQNLVIASVAGRLHEFAPPMVYYGLIQLA